MSLIYKGPCKTEAEKRQCFDYYAGFTEQQHDEALDELHSVLDNLDLKQPESGPELDRLEVVSRALAAVDKEHRTARRAREVNGILSAPASAAQQWPFMGATAPNINLRSGNVNNFTSDIEKRASDAYREAFFAHMAGRELTPEQRTLVSVSSGASVIPIKTYEAVIDGIKGSNSIIDEVRILNIPGKVTLPVSAITSAAVWTPEGTTISASEQPPTSIALSGLTLAKTWDMSCAFASMAIPQFEAYLTEELIRCTKDALATAVFSGNGTTEPQGLATGFTWNATNSIAVSSNQIWETLGAAMALLSANFLPDAIWCMNSDMYYNYVMIENQATTNAPMIVQNVAAGAPLTLFGKRVVIDDHCPDDTAYFGNFKTYFFNFSNDIEIQRSTEEKFSQGLIVYRSIAVVDGSVTAPAFVKVTKS